jgi:hypothetical protein
MTKLTFTKDRIKYWRQLGLPKRFVNEMSTLCSWIFLAFETNSFKANETNVETLLVDLQQFQNCGQHTTGSSKPLSMSSPASTRRHAHNAAYRHVARRGCAPVQPNARNFSMPSIEPLAPHGLSISLHEYHLACTFWMPVRIQHPTSGTTQAQCFARATSRTG